MYPPINLPECDLRIESNNVWDMLRKKWIKLTPEEWVRQHFIHYLIHHLKYSKNLMASEVVMNYGDLKVRADIVIYNPDTKPFIIVECKAPQVKLTEDTFFQAAKYASQLQPEYIILTNGLHHICAHLNKQENKIEFIPEIPIKD